MKNRLKLFILIILLCGVTLSFGAWNWANSPADSKNTVSSMFVIAKGEGIRSIGKSLKEQGLIKSEIAFYLLVKEKSFDNKIQAGDFRLSPSLSLEQIITTLTQGSLDVWVTIPEGKRSEEIVAILKKQLATVTPLWEEEFKKHEGYLFPDTYLIPQDADASLVISLLTSTFEKKYEAAVVKQTSPYTKEEIVILASLIEREAKFPEDREKISSVLHNRLEIGMALQIDATVQYALGFQTQENKWWKGSLTNTDLKKVSPYNTYLHPGFPPTPISNPGLASLLAAANPDNTSYLYYLSDKTGHNHYAETFEQHQANIAKYL